MGNVTNVVVLPLPMLPINNLGAGEKWTDESIRRTVSLALEIGIGNTYTLATLISLPGNLWTLYSANSMDIDLMFGN